MVAWSDLFLPALLATGLVFVVSSVIHMVLQMHNGDYNKLPNEDEVRDALRAGSPKPAQYILPHCLDPKQAAEPEMAKKFEEGPNVVLYIKEPGAMKIGPFLLKWIAYSFAVSMVVGYLAMSTLAAGADYLAVFRVVGVGAWLAYSWSEPADSIWKGKPWSVSMRSLGDGLVYAAVTAGAFAWLWPDA